MGKAHRLCHRFRPYPDHPFFLPAPAGQPDENGLRRFLEGAVLPWFDGRKKELANRPLIREQAFG